MTRAAGRTTVLRDKENATARPGRTVASRAKPPSTQAASEKPENVKPPGLSRATASTAATRAKSIAVAASSKADPATQVKRKREALGEVPKPPENKAKFGAGHGDLKGKERVKEIKEKFEGVVLQKTTTTTTARKPLRAVVDSTTTTTITTTATRRTRTTGPAPSQARGLQPLREDDEDAMAVDSAPLAPIPSPKRFVAAREAARTGVPAASKVPRRVSRPSKPDEDEEEANRVFKKRRTSSDMPDVDALHEEEVENAVVPAEQVEADPFGDQWDDLDVEDADDPLMVSEYVVEIFDYLKEVEVRWHFAPIYAHLMNIPLANHHAEPQLHGQPEGPRVENAWHPHRLAHPGSFPLSAVARDTLLVCQHYRPIPLRPRRVPREVTISRHHVHVHRGEARRDRRSVCKQLPLLC